MHILLISKLPLVRWITLEHYDTLYNVCMTFHRSGNYLLARVTPEPESLRGRLPDIAFKIGKTSARSA